MKFHAICENHLFVKAYKGGTKVVCPTFILYVLPDRHASLLKKQNPEKKKINRIGITTSKKLGNAVKRSRARRVLRAGLSAAMKSGQMRQGFLIVLVAREASVTAKSTDAEKQLIYALKKAGLLT
ncbi:MAG: ribonuclease P protein component [Eubacteriales bacterium]